MYYFAYGMNTNPDQMRLRLGFPKPVGPAVLPGYQLRFALYADIVPKAGSEVLGVLWEIDDSHLKDLDLREGYPAYYERKLVKVMSKGNTVEAIVYYMTPGADLEMPTRRYYSIVADGYRAFGIPTDQIESAVEDVRLHKGQQQWTGKRK